MKKIFSLLLCCLPFMAMAQDSYTLKFLPQLQQSAWANASNMSDAKLSIGFPVISSTSIYLYNTGFTYHDIFHKIDDTTTGLQLGKLINQLKGKNYIGLGTSVALFTLDLSKKNYSFGVSISDKIDFQFAYPGDFFKLLWDGNGSFLGQSLELGNFGINASYYHEIAFHVSKRFGKWQVGINPKMLFGVANINTKET